MPIRVGFLGVAHMHSWGYVSALQSCGDARVVAVWDHETKRKDTFALENGLQQADSIEDLLERSDAVIITSANKSHAELVEHAANAGKPILCEKPLITNEEEANRMTTALVGKSRLMTAFPCRFAPSYIRLKERVKAGDIGPIQAICATNRGRCPFDWFVDVEQSGGGAMIDHTVHVADLLRDLLGEEPSSVQAQIGSNMYGEDWEDTAMLTLQYPSGVFASLDSSWSRPKNFKTWGDVTMNVVGSKGVIELNMFGQSAEVYASAHTLSSFGSNLDPALVGEWLASILEDREPSVTLEDGLAASRVAIAAYQRVKSLEHVA
jgi:predicted dehydrogenase